MRSMGSEGSIEVRSWILNSQWFGKPEEKKKDSEAKSNQKNEPAKVGCFLSLDT